MSGKEMSVEDLLDIATLESLAMLGERRGKDLLGQLVGLFSDQGPKAFATLREALATDNSVVLRETAHSLKGSYRSLGTVRLGDLSTELENLGRADSFEGVEPLLDELEEAFEATEKALLDFVDARRAASGG